MPKVNPKTLKNADVITIDGANYTVMYVKTEGDRIRVYHYGGGSISIPEEKKVLKK